MTSLTFEALMSVLEMRWMISTAETQVVVVGERWGKRREVGEMTVSAPAEENYSHLLRGPAHL